jgi:hypothetical protein
MTEECRILEYTTQFISHRKHLTSRRLVSSGMLCRVALVKTDVSENLRASFIRMTRIGELGTTLVVTNNRRTLAFLRSMRRLLVTASVPSSPILVTLMKEPLRSSETSVITRATRRNIPVDTILQEVISFTTCRWALGLRNIFWEGRGGRRPGRNPDHSHTYGGYAKSERSYQSLAFELKRCALGVKL